MHPDPNLLLYLQCSVEKHILSILNKVEEIKKAGVKNKSPVQLLAQQTACPTRIIRLCTISLHVAFGNYRGLPVFKEHSLIRIFHSHSEIRIIPTLQV